MRTLAKGKLSSARHLAYVLAVGVLGLGASVAGCSSTPASSGAASSGAASAAPKQPPHGGTLTVVQKLISNFDPAYSYISDFAAGALMAPIYGPGLVYQNFTTGAVEMGFAKSLTSSDGGKVWTLVLHGGLKFSDGTPFNATAVKANFKRLANPAIGSGLQPLAAEITPIVVNATTLTMRLPTKEPEFPSILAQDFSIIPSPTAVKAEGSSFATAPVGPGPFKVKSLVPNVSLSLVRNPYYSGYAPGEPYLNSLVFTQETTQTQTLATVESGQAQIATVINGQQVAQDKQAGMNVNSQLSLGGDFLSLNENIPPFNNKLAREAVYLALNRADIVAAWAPGSPVSTNFFPKESPYYSTALDWPASNSAKAQQLFNQLAAEGKPVNFSILWVTGSVLPGADYLQAELNAYKNVHVSVNAVLTSSFIQDRDVTDNYQMTADDLSDPSIFPELDQTFQTGGPLNYAHVNDPILNHELETIDSSPNATVVSGAVHSFFKELSSQYDIIFCQTNDSGMAWVPSLVGGVQPVEIGTFPIWGEVYKI